MVSWRSWFRLVFLTAAVGLACSGSSDKPGGSSSGGKGGKSGSGSSGKGGAAGRAGNAMSVGGSMVGESGENTGAVGATGMTVGGSAGFAAFGGSAGSGPAAGSVGVGGTGTTPVPPGWTCATTAYNDGVCDCGCSVRDADCGENDIDECKRCNTTGSCDFRECPGKIDPENITRCLAPPPEWTCSTFYYADGKDCDCGCGAVDLDCEDETVDSCDYCGAFGACSGGACPGPIDPDDNGVCKTPSGWTCLPFYYADGSSCDCGCGITDPDCDSESRDECDTCYYGCSEESCPGPIDADDNAICTGVPGAWRCKARFYNDGICDCGCGAVDFDCDPAEFDSCATCNLEGSCSKRDCEEGTVDEDNIAFCTRPAPPDDWTCQSYAYADGFTCDCGCGAIDLDCPDDTIASCQSCGACGSGLCPGLVDPADISGCTDPPDRWYCQKSLYADGYCDCGCGVRDPDCADDLKETCKRCSIYDGSCAPYDCSTILPTNNALCTDSPPPEWTCPLDYYDDGRCDCGCGIKDVDCATAKRTSCQVCNAPGSCSDVRCKDSDIDADNNAICTP